MKNGLVRRGNHFIRMPDDTWGLIDGPWFDELERIRDGGFMPVRLQSLASLQIQFMDSLNAYPSSYEADYIEWEPRRYHPSYRSWRWSLDNPLYGRWRQWLAGRIRIAYVMLPDGKVPPFFNSATLPPDERERDYLLWNMK